MEPSVQIDLTIPQVNVLLQALGKQPAEVSMDLILLIREQVNPQLEAQAED